MGNGLPTPLVDTGSKVAVIDVSAVMVIVQVLVPVHPPPDQPEKIEPVSAVAVRVTDVPLLYASEQSVPQLTPAGLEVTVPPPVPALVTVRVKV